MSSKRMITLTAALAFAGLLGNSQPSCAAPDHQWSEPHRTARSIIFMVPDGMSLADVTATRLYKYGPEGGHLSFEELPVIGYQSTYAANSTVTDSAAAASAWAAGAKFNNGEISCHSIDTLCVERPLTLLELARAKGKATGLVATSTITHATPAAWGAHVNSRQCQAEIGRQFIEESGVDVLLGGGIAANSSNPAYNCAQYPGQDPAAVVSAALERGYTYTTTREEMQAAVASGTSRLLGLFTADGKSPETFRVDPSLTYPLNEPTLPEMTAAALDVLKKDKDGFFLMVEGSQIDWANHDNNLTYKLGEMLAFDEAVATVQAWIADNPQRMRDTLLIVVPDHDTGGFAINGPYGNLSQANEMVQPGWTSLNHTAGDVQIWSQGPASHRLGRAVDNTDIHRIIKEVMN